MSFLDFSSEASHQKCDPTLISVSMEGWGYSNPRQIICDLYLYMENLEIHFFFLWVHSAFPPWVSRVEWESGFVLTPKKSKIRE